MLFILKPLPKRRKTSTPDHIDFWVRFRFQGTRTIMKTSKINHVWQTEDESTIIMKFDAWDLIIIQSRIPRFGYHMTYYGKDGVYNHGAAVSYCAKTSECTKWSWIRFPVFLFSTDILSIEIFLVFKLPHTHGLYFTECGWKQRVRLLPFPPNYWEKRFWFSGVM